MSYIILIRMNSGQLWTIEDQENDRVEEFDTLEDAEAWLDKSALATQPWEIIAVDV